jgi:hypothetical protein
MRIGLRLIVALLSVLVIFSFIVMMTGCNDSSATATAEAANNRCEHEIKGESCPFCHPELIVEEGFCGAHGFPEALCAQCRPAIKVAFRAQNDWCNEHKLPESQCVNCDPDLATNIQPGVHGGSIPSEHGHSDDTVCVHTIESAQCPFCDPSLVDSEGFCNGHGVPEALCVKCRPFMQAAFQVKGDWCSEHNTPETQCEICSP